MSDIAADNDIYANELTMTMLRSDDFIIYTKEIRALEAKILEIVMLGNCGACVVSRPRCGKTTSMVYIARSLKQRYGEEFPVVMWDITDHPVTEKNFYSTLLTAMGVKHTVNHTALVLKNRVLSELVTLASDTPFNKVVLMIDEAWRLDEKYDSYLQGTNGKILTLTDARGIEIENAGETRLEPVNGYDLNISMDYNIQLYCEQAAEKTYIKKDAKYVSVIVMNPSNGEIFAMVNYPEFHLNDPFTLTEEVNVPAEKKQDLLNQMWRNQCISDTYEPGSTFKIITAAVALEQGVVKLTDNFYCPGYKLVEDRRIRCAKTTGHGAETFETGIMNSCNPVFIELGERLGVENFYKYFSQFGLLSKKNVDLPGEAATIMHKKENVGPVELATISFGQSFQITPMQLVTTVSSIINGGHRITPHFGVKITGEGGKEVETLRYETKNDICTKETSETMRYLLERVVSDGSGKNAKIEGVSIGGKTATSQTLPRSDHKYISSFLGFAPADDPKVLVLVVINDPKGTYYGGQIAAPVAKEIMENILPYLAK